MERRERKSAVTTSQSSFSVGGTTTRGLIFLLGKTPTSHMGAAKLPKTSLVFMNFFHFLQLETSLKEHSNPLTLATTKAAKAAAEKTLPNLLTVWHHFADLLLVKTSLVAQWIVH